MRVREVDLDQMMSLGLDRLPRHRTEDLELDLIMRHRHSALTTPQNPKALIMTVIKPH